MNFVKSRVHNTSFVHNTNEKATSVLCYVSLVTTQPIAPVMTFTSVSAGSFIEMNKALHF